MQYVGILYSGSVVGRSKQESYEVEVIYKTTCFYGAIQGTVVLYLSAQTGGEDYEHIDLSTRNLRKV